MSLKKKVLLDAIECWLWVVVFCACLQDIDIKKVNGVPQYAFLQYCDIASVCKAIKKMDGEYLGNNRLKVKKTSPGLYPSCVFHCLIMGRFAAG